MNEKKINEVYDGYENIVMTNFYSYAIVIFGISVIVLLGNLSHITISTLIPFIAVIPTAMILSGSNINKNIRKYKKEHKSFKFSKNILKLDKNRKETLEYGKTLKGIKNNTKNNSIKKQDKLEVKENLLSENVSLEKVKVKTYKK